VVSHALVALFLISGDLQVQADGVSETRAGEAPILAGQSPSAFVAQIVTPVAALRYSDVGVSFEVNYAPRIFWRDPSDMFGTSGPLVLHTANLGLSVRTTRRLTLSAGATGSIGQPDYTFLPQLLGTTQGSLPQIAEIETGTGRVTAGVRLSRRWDLELGGELFYWSYRGTPMGLPTGIITSEKSALEQAGLLYRLTLRHQLGLGAVVKEASFSDGLDVLSVGPAAIWRVRLTPVDELRLTAGVTYLSTGGTLAPGAMSLVQPGEKIVFPVGRFELTSRVARRDEVMILANAAGGVESFVDPIVGNSGPRAIAAAGLQVYLEPNWMWWLRGDFSTALRSTPVVVAPNAAPPDETTFGVKLSCLRRLSPYFFGELGGYWADRGPAFVTPNFHFHQRQLWVYVQVIGTTRTVPQSKPPPKEGQVVDY
jgi:hypothetical protein